MMEPISPSEGFKIEDPAEYAEFMSWKANKAKISEFQQEGMNRNESDGDESATLDGDWSNMNENEVESVEDKSTTSEADWVRIDRTHVESDRYESTSTEDLNSPISERGSDRTMTEIDIMRDVYFHSIKRFRKERPGYFPVEWRTLRKLHEKDLEITSCYLDDLDRLIFLMENSSHNMGDDCGPFDDQVVRLQEIVMHIVDRQSQSDLTAGIVFGDDGEQDIDWSWAE